jgi:aspartate carbamoyltransferase catalytic subunit
VTDGSLDSGASAPRTPVEAPAINAAGNLGSPSDRSLLGIEKLARPEIEHLLRRAAHYKRLQIDRRDHLREFLSGKTIVNLFFEASTRTRTSFEIAAKRLGAHTVSIEAQGSSLSKGESLVDTLNTLAAMQPDAIVMRHAASGAPHFLSRFLPTPIINAGDGRHEHPTQALLDAMTILERKESLEGLRVAIIGDIMHSRVARSNVHLLSKFGVDIVLCGPATMLSSSLKDMVPGITLTNNMNEAVADADVVMMLRVQLERQKAPIFPKNEYFQFFGLSIDHLQLAKPDVLVMHPGPINRGRELSSEVADSKSSVILNQVQNGLSARMAVLERACGSEWPPRN